MRFGIVKSVRWWALGGQSAHLKREIWDQISHFKCALWPPTAPCRTDFTLLERILINRLHIRSLHGNEPYTCSPKRAISKGRVSTRPRSATSRIGWALPGPPTPGVAQDRVHTKMVSAQSGQTPNVFIGF